MSDTALNIKKEKTVVASTSRREMPKRNIPELKHRNFKGGEFWQKVPAWAAGVKSADFGSHLWQLKNSITKVDQVEKLLGPILPQKI